MSTRVKILRIFEYDVKTLSSKHYLILILPENNRNSVFRQPFILVFTCHKSATIGQIDSNKAPNAKSKPDQFNDVKTKTMKATVHNCFMTPSTRFSIKNELFYS